MIDPGIRAAVNKVRGLPPDMSAVEIAITAVETARPHIEALALELAGDDLAMQATLAGGWLHDRAKLIRETQEEDE